MCLAFPRVSGARRFNGSADRREAPGGLCAAVKMVLELFLDLLSQPCRSVYMFAKKNNIPFEFRKVALMDGETYTDEFGKVSLIRKVPALRDGDFCLAESIAILLYLAEKFQTPEFWYPADIQQRARINEYMSWQHMAIRMHGSKYFWFKVLIPQTMNMTIPEDKMQAAVEDLNSSLDLVENKFLQDKSFIAGDQVSLADLVAIVEIMQPVAAGLDVFQDRPRLSAWRDRVQAIVGKELFDEAHQGILGARENVKQLDPQMMAMLKPKIIRMFM